MCAALARSLMIWIKQDGVGHEFVAHQLAELESIVSADMQARAEAAEAACVAKDAKIQEGLCFAGGRYHEWGSRAVGAFELFESVSDISPAETRSVIAGLREEVKELKWCKDQNEILVFAGLGSLGDQRGKNHVADIIADTLIERDALRAQLAALISVVVPHIEDLRKTSAELSAPSLAGCFDLTAAEILIAADELQAAVSGAHAGAKGKQP